MSEALYRSWVVVVVLHLSLLHCYGAEAREQTHCMALTDLDR